MSNGTVKAAIDFMKEKPKWALVFVLLISQGTISYGVGFLPFSGSRTKEIASLGKLTEEIKTLQENVQTGAQEIRTLKSEIKAERQARIAEITYFKEDGKLLSGDSIRLMFKEELERFEEKLLKSIRRQ